MTQEPEYEQQLRRTLETGNILDFCSRTVQFNPHAYKEDYFNKKTINETVLGTEINALVIALLEERGIPIFQKDGYNQRDDNFSIFRLSQVQNGENEYVVPDNSEIKSLVQRTKFRRQVAALKRNRTIDAILRGVFSRSFDTAEGPLEKELVLLNSLYATFKMLDHAYFASFVKLTGLPYESIQDMSYDVFQGLDESKFSTSHGNIEDDSTLNRMIKRTSESLHRVEEFQFVSGEAFDYLGSPATEILRLRKILYLKTHFGLEGGVFSENLESDFEDLENQQKALIRRIEKISGDEYVPKMGEIKNPAYS